MDKTRNFDDKSSGDHTFNQLDLNEQERLRTFIESKVSEQSQSAKELLQNFQKHIIAANTGGVAATIALLSQVEVSIWFTVGLTFFVLGIIVALWWAINLPFRLGAAVGGGNRIRVKVLNSEITVAEMNREFQELNSNLNYNAPDRFIKTPLHLFMAGVLVTLIGLTSIALRPHDSAISADQSAAASAGTTACQQNHRI